MKLNIPAVVVTAAVASLGGVAALDSNRPDAHYVLQQNYDGGCVVPDCRNFLGRGVWDSKHDAVDCRAAGPYAMGLDGGRWRGCNVMRVEYAMGAQCLPAACDLPYGVEPFTEAPSE